MWGIPSLALDICSLCEILDDRPTKATSSSTTSARRSKGRPEKRQKQQQLELDTDTVVIGNGPAGIALSAMLSGWQPFYNKQRPHPDPLLHQRLSDMSSGDESLFSGDLSSLAAHSASSLSSNPGQTPFAVLYDSLARPFPAPSPSSDLNNNPPPRPRSCLCWRRNTGAAVPHIVLGDQGIGGSWTGYDDDMVTVSVSEWMDLPGYSLASDFMGAPGLAHARPRAALYKHYLLAYVLVMGLEQNFRPCTRVTQLEKFCHPLTGEQYWEVRGVESTPTPPASPTEQQQQQLKGDGVPREFLFRCRNVVLACGQQQPKMLGVPGELTPTAGINRRIVYNLSSLKRCLTAEEEGEEADADYSLRAARASRPVVVVGDGISAADAVLHCLAVEQPVLHVIRRGERELRNIQLARLSPTVYPEYARVYALMTGRTREVNYRRVLGTRVHAVEQHSSVVLLDNGPVGISNPVREHFLCLAVCIGRRSELPLLRKEYQHQQHSHQAPYEFSTDYQSTTDQSLFAVGAMAGDHFVRYLVGGALCVAQTLTNKFHQRQHLLAATAIPRPVSPAPQHQQQRGGCAMLRTASAAGPLAAAIAMKAAVTAGAELDTRRRVMGQRTKSQLQLLVTAAAAMV